MAQQQLAAGAAHVIDAGGTVLGFVLVVSGVVEMLYVKRDFRGEGFGVELLRAAAVIGDSVPVRDTTGSWRAWCRAKGLRWEKVGARGRPATRTRAGRLNHVGHRRAPRSHPGTDATDGSVARPRPAQEAGAVVNAPHHRLATRLLSRQGRASSVVCAICTRDTHYGVQIETVRVTNGRKVTLLACYDCIEVCHLIAVGRMPCAAFARQWGVEGPPGKADGS
jgi:hypothetical protein